MRSFERYSPLAGVVAVVLWIVGVVVVESGDASRDDETAAGSLRWFTENENSILGGELIFAIGVLFFLWFVGTLRTAFFMREADGHLTALFFASGVIVTTAMLAQAALLIQPSFADEGALTGEAAQALWMASDSMFGVIQLGLVVFFVTAGLLLLRTGLMPRWLAWASFLIALLLLIVPIGWVAVVFLFPAWIVVVAVLLWMRPAGEPQGPPAASLT